MDQMRRIATPLVAALVLAGCAATGAPEPAADIVPVEVRAEERWDRLVEGDFAAAYGYLSPGYRSSVSSVNYQRRMLLSRVTWKDAQVKDTECTEDTCKVRISLDYLLVKPVPGVDRLPRTRDIEEDWILVDGEWFHVPE